MSGLIRRVIAAVAGASTIAAAAACGSSARSVSPQRSSATQAAASDAAAPSYQPTTTGAAPRLPPAVLVPRPPIHQWPIPYGQARKGQMAGYSLRHYGENTYLLAHPKVIVEHFTETANAQAAYNTFAPDVPDSEFGELPNVCSHFLVEANGRIDQLVPLWLRCRHTVGLNWTAIGIEHVGFSDQQILHRPAQISASLALTRWLRCRYKIALKNVIGHNESLASPYHHELVPAFRHQTHNDWNRTDMQRYRALLARYSC